jgi:hypothetical protein
MSVLRDRIVGMPLTDLRIKGTLDGPMMHPTQHIQIYRGTIASQDLMPIIATDGAPIPATSPGTWGQLYAVGRT